MLEKGENLMTIDLGSYIYAQTFTGGDGMLYSCYFHVQYIYLPDYCFPVHNYIHCSTTYQQYIKLFYHGGTKDQ